MMRQTRRRLTVTPDLPSDAFILREPYQPLLAACAAAAAVAPDIKVLEGRVVSGDQFVSPAEQKERILATFGDLCCEMEGCTIAQAAYLNGVPLVVVRAISDKPCAEGQVVDYNTFEKKAACDCARIAARRALSKTKCRAEVLSVGPKCSMAVVFYPSSGGLFLGAVDSPHAPPSVPRSPLILPVRGGKKSWTRPRRTAWQRSPST